MKSASILLLLLVAFDAHAEDRKPKARVRVKGSDTLSILVDQWADAFAKSTQDIKVETAGGGTNTGITALLLGTTDIATASRPMKRGELEKLRARFKTLPGEVTVARDALSFYVHKDNPVNALTMAQLRGLWTGEITNWKEVGGPDAPVVLISREATSGTYDLLKDTLLKKADFAANVRMVPGTAAVVNAVSKDAHAIGYGGAAYGRGVKELQIKVGDETFAPSAENVKSGKYPLARDLYFFLRGEPSGSLKRFVDFALSSEGQALVAKVGYYPVK